MNDINEELIYTITQTEFRQRERQRLTLIGPGLLIVAITLFVGFYQTQTWQHSLAYSGMILFLISIISLYYVKRRATGERTYVINKKGISITYRSKSITYHWDDFDKLFTQREYMSRFSNMGGVYNRTLNKLSDDLENTHGNVFMLQLRKRQLLFFRKYVEVYAEPDNFTTVKKLINYYIKKHMPDPRKIML